MDASRKSKSVSCVIYLKDKEKIPYEQALTKVLAMRKEFQMFLVEDLLETKEINYVDESVISSFPEEIIDLYAFKEYKPEWWVGAYQKMYGEPSNVADKWVICLKFNIKKMVEFNINLREIAVAIENVAKQDDFSCVCSPDHIGRIDVYVNFSKVDYAIPSLDLEDVDVTLLTEKNIHYYYTRDIVIKTIQECYISGIVGISNIFPRETKSGEVVLDTDGCDFIEVLGHEKVDAVNTVCNNMWQIYRTLGIEAARLFLIEEFTQVLCSGGSYINPRHIMLLADTMTQGGTISNVRREGIDRKSVGPLAKATFEKTFDSLVESATFSEQDSLRSVSSRITMGILLDGGTGFVHTEMAPSYIPTYEKAVGANPHKRVPQKKKPKPAPKKPATQTQIEIVFA